MAGALGFCDGSRGNHEWCAGIDRQQRGLEGKNLDAASSARESEWLRGPIFPSVLHANRGRALLLLCPSYALCLFRVFVRRRVQIDPLQIDDVHYSCSGLYHRMQLFFLHIEN